MASTSQTPVSNGPTSQHSAPPGACALFCLPYAGGDATAFWAWQSAFGASARLEFITLPGRGRPAARPGEIGESGEIGEIGEISAQEIAREIAARVVSPYAIYGHSMGARLAFEVTRALIALGAPPPVRIFVGAAHPPHLPEPLARIAHVTEDEFIDQLILRAGAPEELRADHDVRTALMPALRTDLEWLKRYRYRHGEPLPVPIVAFAGTVDREVSGDVMLGWARHTSAWFRLHTITGGHLFLSTAGDVVADLISAEVATAVASNGSGPSPVATPAADEIHVWRASLDRMPRVCSAVDELSPREQARSTAFRHDVDRRRYVGRCVLLRRLLRRYGADLGRREIPTGPHGKPYVQRPAGLRFSLSHSRGTLLVALAREQEIGVDVERLRPMVNFEAFCDGALTNAENAEVAAEPEESQLLAGLRFWTAKEAVLKATGDGLGVEPTAFSFANQPREGIWRPDPDPRVRYLADWTVTRLDLDGAVGAIATTRIGWRLRYETAGELSR
ncbi:MAG: alpha/beta fold hydrolase [Thermocrispum sp.]